MYYLGIIDDLDSAINKEEFEKSLAFLTTDEDFEQFVNDKEFIKLLDRISKNLYMNACFPLLIDKIKSKFTKEHFDECIYDVAHNHDDSAIYLIETFPEYVDSEIINEVYNHVGWYVVRYSGVSVIDKEYVKREDWCKILTYLKRKGATLGFYWDGVREKQMDKAYSELI